MTKHDRFVMLVQTYVLAHPMLKSNHFSACSTLVLAMNVPAVAIPDDVWGAVLHWCGYVLDDQPKPAWLLEFEENVTNKITLEQLDGDPAWWRHAEEMVPENAPASWHAFVSGRARLVEFTKGDAKAFVEWARELPGWSEEDPPLREVE